MPLPFGLASVCWALSKGLKNSSWSLACVLVPIQMASQTWDDHDRSGRYLCRDFGRNYLMTLPDKGNPIIFTNGDNDTFPLWYNQETEGVRTDARVCNFSYLQTDWYIDQMKRPAYDSPSLPITWSRLEYVSNGEHELVHVDASQKQALLELNRQYPDVNMFEVSYIMKNFVRASDPEQRFIPTDSMVITVDKEAVRRSGMMLKDSIPDVMTISLKGRSSVYKNELMFYEMISQSNWKRPIYVAITVGADNYGSLGDNFIKEGLAYRISPFNTEKTKNTIDVDKMYDNLMNRYRYGGLDKPGLYIDENAMRMCWSHRVAFSQTVLQLLLQGDTVRAQKALDYCEKQIPEYNVPYDWRSGAIELARAYAFLGNDKKADYILSKIATDSRQFLTWYNSLNTNELMSYRRDYMLHLEVLRNVLRTYQMFDEAKMKKTENEIMQYYGQWQSRTGDSFLPQDSGSGAQQ